MWFSVATFPEFMSGEGLPVLSESARGRTGAQPLDVRSVHRDHAAFVWRSLQRLGVRSAELEDAHQEVFIVVYRRLSTFDGSSKLTSWLFGICLRVASASRRRAHHRREQLTADVPEGVRVDAGPEARLQQAETAAFVDRILDALDLEKRAIFVMFEMDQLSCQEIADIVGIPLGTVHSRLHAARKEFQDAVKRSTLREQRAESHTLRGAS